MSDMTAPMGIDETEMTFAEKLGSWCVWATAAALFLTIGWFAMRPNDPVGAVSVLTRHQPALMLVQAAALAAVVAGLATVVAGRKLADAGTFAAALGLVAVSLRGGTAEYLLVQGAEAGGGARELALKFAGEAAAWFVVLLAAPVVSSVVARWTSDSIHGDAGRHPATGGAAEAVMMLHDVSRSQSRDGSTDPRTGLKHTIIAATIGFAAFRVLGTGLSTRSIQHGQSSFVFAAAVASGCYFAHRLYPVRSALWSSLGVIMLTFAGLAWAIVSPGDARLPVNIPTSPFLRILPIQYASVGAATTVAMQWYLRAPPEGVAAHQRQRERSPAGIRV